jgi:hypothetical protein
MKAGYRFLLLVVGYALWIGAAQKPPFLLRIHLQATEGAKGMVSVPVTLFQPNETIAIQSLPEVTEKEIRNRMIFSDKIAPEDRVIRIRTERNDSDIELGYSKIESARQWMKENLRG